MSYATTGELAAANARIDKLEKEIEEIKERLGIMVINHKFDETDVKPDFQKRM